MKFLVIFYICFSLTWSWLLLRYYLHMFQLNSYKKDVQFRWILCNWYKKTGKNFLFPKKAKKPLQYTARIWRLYATLILLLPLWLIPPLMPFLILLANEINRPIEWRICAKYTKEAKKILKSHTNLIVIGITGSYGKTSVKHFLYTILSAKYNVLMTPGGVNTPMGVVRCVRESLTAAHEVFLCEMGAKNIGDIRELCEMVCPKYGIITSIGPQHLESFGTIESVISTKFELADELPDNGILFANGNDENIIKKLPEYDNFITFGLKNQQYQSEEIHSNESGTSFHCILPNGTREVLRTRLLGQHNIENLLAAISVSCELGIDFDKIRGRIRKIFPVPHRLELTNWGGILTIDDAYNSNPAGAKAALETLLLFDDHEKILVTPGMIELGSRQIELNEIFGKQAGKICDFIILVGENQTKPILNGIRSVGFPLEKLEVVRDFQEAQKKIFSLNTIKPKIVLYENDLPDNY